MAVWTSVVLALAGVWLLYEQVPWVRALLGLHRSQIGLGVLILALPLLLVAWLLGRRRK